jgi:Uma2 family endonuclease
VDRTETEMAVKTLEDIRHALEALSTDERHVIARWLQELISARDRSYRVEEPQPAYAHAQPFMTVDEYMKFEEQSSFRHEYVNGVVHAMSGPSLAHVRITGKLFVALETHLRGSPCEPFATDAKLRIRSEADEIIYYPDVVVACNRDEWGTNYVCNPKLVVEILSPSTEHIDRREKAMTYRRVVSIEEYVLLEQDEHKVIVHRRAENWKPQVYMGPQAVAEFLCISLSVPLAQIYAGTLPAG